MLRDLATVLQELHDGLADSGRAATLGLRIVAVQMVLPMDLVAILREGGCVLLADVPRSHADAEWRDRASRLLLHWQAQPIAEGAASREEQR